MSNIRRITRSSRGSAAEEESLSSSPAPGALCSHENNSPNSAPRPGQSESRPMAADDDGDEGADSYFNFEEEPVESNAKPSANENSATESSANEATTKMPQANKDVLDNIFGSDLFSINHQTDPSFTSAQRDNYLFPGPGTVEWAKQHADPHLIGRLGKGCFCDAQAVLVYDFSDQERLVGAFSCIYGKGGVSEGSLYHAFKMEDGIHPGSRTLSALEQMNNEGKPCYGVFKIVGCSYDEYQEKLKELTAADKNRFEELVRIYKEKRAKQEDTNSSYNKNASLNSISNRKAGEFIVVNEWDTKSHRTIGKPVMKYRTIHEARKSMDLTVTSGLGHGWTVAGYKKFGEISALLGTGAIWKNVFLLKYQESSGGDLDEEYDAVEVNTSRFLELQQKHFHKKKCKKNCDCLATKVLHDYMKKDNRNDFLEKLERD